MEWPHPQLSSSETEHRSLKVESRRWVHGGWRKRPLGLFVAGSLCTISPILQLPSPGVQTWLVSQPGTATRHQRS